MLNRETDRATRSRAGIHYAWVIIALAAIMHSVGSSISLAFGVMVVPLQDRMGWSPASITFAYTIAFIVGAVLGPICGIATDRFGARKVLLLGIALFFVGAITIGISSEVWHLWISYGICLGAAQLFFNIPILATASYWFRKRLGTGVGLLLASEGIGPGATAVIFGILIASLDWKIAFWSIGVAGVFGMSALMVFFRNRPSDMGIRPYGAPAAEPLHAKRDTAIDEMRSRAYRSRMQSTGAFWNLVAVHFLGCLGHAIVIVYVIPIAVLAGVGEVAAAGVLSTLAIVSALTRFFTPVAADHLGAKRTMATMFFLQGLPVLMLFWTQEVWQFYLFAVIFGFAYGGENSGFPVANRQYFGHGPMGRPFGWQSFGAGMGMGLGGWLGGVLFAIYGSYNPAVILSAAASIGGCLVLLSMESTNRPLIPDWADSLPQEGHGAPAGETPSAD